MYPNRRKGGEGEEDIGALARGCDAIKVKKENSFSLPPTRHIERFATPRLPLPFILDYFCCFHIIV